MLIQLFGGEPSGFGVAPEIPVALRARPARARLDEPRVLVAGVVRHVVDEDADAALVGRGRAASSKSASDPKSGIDVGVVGDVVAEVGHRRGVEGRDPDRVDAEPGEVVEPAGDAGEVAGAVAGRIGEAARVDLVDDAGLPPAIGGGCILRPRLAGWTARAILDRPSSEGRSHVDDRAGRRRTPCSRSIQPPS